MAYKTTYYLCKVIQLSDELLKEHPKLKEGDFVAIKAGMFYTDLNITKYLVIEGEYTGKLDIRTSTDKKDVEQLRKLCMKPADILVELKKETESKDAEIIRLKKLLEEKGVETE